MALGNFKGGCPFGNDVAGAIDKNGGDTSALATRVATLEGYVTVLNTKLAAVLAAKDTDEGKTLQIDNAGNVKILTVV